jgi:hypothetical protein
MTNIAKLLVVVILVGACDHGHRMPAFDEQNSPFGTPSVLGPLPADLKESSGLAVSLCQENVLWTHNDSGDVPAIYAIDMAGKLLGIWTVAGAEHKDWEDMGTRRDGSGKCWLYLADIGNTNGRGRKSHRIYRVEEPQLVPASPNLEKEIAPETASAETLEFQYPDGSYDAEAMIVHPRTEEVYVLTKEKSKPSTIYKLAPAFGDSGMQMAVRVGEFTVPTIPNGFLTGASIFPDGRSIAICDYAAGYEITLPDAASSFDEIWKQAPRAFSLGNREQGEAIAYGVDRDTIFATSERKGGNLIEVKRQKNGR